MTSLSSREVVGLIIDVVVLVVPAVTFAVIAIRRRGASRSPPE